MQREDNINQKILFNSKYEKTKNSFCTGGNNDEGKNAWMVEWNLEKLRIKCEKQKKQLGNLSKQKKNFRSV